MIFLASDFDSIQSVDIKHDILRQFQNTLAVSKYGYFHTI